MSNGCEDDSTGAHVPVNTKTKRKKNAQTGAPSLRAELIRFDQFAMNLGTRIFSGLFILHAVADSRIYGHVGYIAEKNAEHC